jgi:hypothetical protein
MLEQVQELFSRARAVEMGCRVLERLEEMDTRMMKDTRVPADAVWWLQRIKGWAQLEVPTVDVMEPLTFDPRKGSFAAAVGNLHRLTLTTGLEPMRLRIKEFSSSVMLYEAEITRAPVTGAAEFKAPDLLREMISEDEILRAVLKSDLEAEEYRAKLEAEKSGLTKKTRKRKSGPKV